MNEKDFILPEKILNGLEITDINTSLTCNSILFGKEIAGFMVVCDENMFKKFKIIEECSKIEGINHKFRMISSDAVKPLKLYVFEFEILFRSKLAMKIHQDPSSTSFKNLCKLAIKTQKLSIHFENIKTKQTVSTHFLLDSDDLDWIKRNLELANSIKLSSFSKILSEHLVGLNKNSDIHYFLPNKKIKFAGFK